MGEKFAAQRATKVDAGEFQVAVCCQRTIKLGGLSGYRAV
jgi:hypothetical protein